MRIECVNDYNEMSKSAAKFVTEKLLSKPNITLGLATGSTPKGMYQHLVREQVSFKHVTTFNLDEYVGLGRNQPNSYYHYMRTNLFDHLDLPENQTNIPNGLAENADQECENYEKLILESGGIDLQILGIGHNGHIGFNEPGTSFESATHIVQLTPSTREANARFFNDSLTHVPKQAITMGIATIMKSKEILLLVSGQAKRTALTRLLASEITEKFPASVLKLHPHVTIIADKDACERS